MKADVFINGKFSNQIDVSDDSLVCLLARGLIDEGSRKVSYMKSKLESLGCVVYVNHTAASSSHPYRAEQSAEAEDVIR